MVNKNLSLLNDQAIIDTQYDGLDFEIYSQAISDTIISTRTPFTIGIYGDTGAGKTSLLNLVYNNIEKTTQNIFNVFYDAWKYESDTQTLLVLIDLIESKIINDRFKYHEDTIASMIDYIQFIKKAIKTLHVNLSNTQTNHEVVHTSIEVFQLFRSFENLLEEQKIQIIIYVDNLEKCKSDNIIKILNSINMVFDLHGFTFVIGANKEFLESKISTSNDKQIDYMNKMVQLPFFIPILNTKISNFISNISQNNNIEIEEEIKKVLLALSSLRSLSPRLIIKIINKIKLSYEIYSRINSDSNLSKNKIISLFSITCTLEELFRDFYLLIVKNDSLIFQIVNRLQNQEYLNDDFIQNLNISENQKFLIAKTLKENFGILKMIFGTEEGKFWLENKNYRISAYEFIKTHYPQKDISFDSTIHTHNNNEPINPKQFIPIPGQDFEMSRYVITNQWFNEFIQAGGYDNMKYWNEIAANIWLMKNKISSLDEKYDKMVNKEGNFFEKKYKEPLYKKNFNDDLQPIVYITYYEALAFCNYLNDIDSSYIYSIPTKEQWEFVAKGGAENRIYPWGNSWNKNYCNNAQIQLNRTSQIGMFPQGDSKFGISDIAGNVWVWTSSLEKNNLNYLKGGSWNFADPSYFKVTNNGQITFYNNAEYQHYDIGFYCIRTKKYEDSI